MDNNTVYPKVSFITIVFNNKENLRKTLTAIRNQTYVNKETVIIDGGSTDGTLDIIAEFRDIISYSVSEKDNGIYDAMNKGLRAATGDFVWFMNSGDLPYGDDTLMNVFKTDKEGDVYYGDTEMVDDDGKSYGNRTLKVPPKELNWKKMINGMIVSHQSMIVRKAVCVEYDLSYRYVADIDWAIKVLKKSTKVINTNLTLSKFLIGGYSRQNTIESLKERFNLLCRHFNCVRVLLNHVKLSFRFIVYIIRKRKLL
ncbi:MAG: glycosyltransferase family 2 protein [Ignavibacteriota bacterium]